MIYLTYAKSKFFYPYSTLIFCSILKQNKIEFKCIHDPEDIKDSKEDDILCMSMIYSSYQEQYDSFIANFKGKRVIIGGDSAVGHGLKFWEDRWKDKTISLCIGPGEEVLIPLIKDPSIKEIIGTISNSNNILLPDYSVLDLKEFDIGFEAQTYKLWCNQLDKNKFPTYKDFRIPYGLICASRGCWNDCSFCTNRLMHNNKYIYFTPDRIYEEIMLLKSVGVNWLIFIDTDFGSNKNKLVEMCRMFIDKKIDMPWDCEGIGQTWDLETLMIMKQAGCFYIRFGLESSSIPVRTEFNKMKIDIEKIKKVVMLAKEIDLPVHLNLIIGAQCETDKTIQDTIDFINTFNIDYYSISHLNIYVGTPMYKKLGIESSEPYHSKEQLDRWQKFMIDNIKTGTWEGNVTIENDVYKSIGGV